MEMTLKSKELITIKGLVKKYQNHIILKNIDLTIKEGEFISIIGPIGCGKTTLLKIIGNLIKYEKGKIIIHKRNTVKIRAVFQQPKLLPWLTIEENIAFPLKLSEAKLKVKNIIEQLKLQEHSQFLPHEISGGLMQKAALARALVDKPTLLLLDEPFKSLDEKTALQIYEEGQSWNKNISSKMTVFHITHSLAEAAFLSDKIIILSKRPTIIKKVVINKLSKPRTKKTMHSKEFWELIRCMHKELDT